MTKDVFHFDPESHRYKLNGAVIPGISFVLENTGFVEKTWFRPEHAARGHAVHACCQFLIEGNLDWSTVHPDILPRVKAFERFLDGSRPRLILAEKPLYSKTWMFGGTPDLLLEIAGRITIIDIKSGASGLAAMLQTAAQGILLMERLEFKQPPARYALELRRDGGMRMVHHSNPGDKIMFLNALAITNRKINEGELSHDK